MRAARIVMMGLLALIGACGVSTDTDRDLTGERAQVRVVNAVLDTPALDVFATRTAAIPAFGGLPSQGASGYVGFDEGDFQFIAHPANTPDAIAELDLHLAKFERVVLVLSGSVLAGSVGIAVFDDTQVDPGPDQARLRLINASADVDPLGFSIDGAPLADTAPIGGELEAFVAPQPVRVAAGSEVASTSFTTPALEQGTDVMLVATGTSADLHMVLVPATTRANITAAAPVAPDPFAVFVNGVPGAASSLTVGGAAQGSLAFGALSPRIQVPLAPSITLGGREGSLGALDGAATYLVVLAPDAASATKLSTFAYRDTLSASADTRVRAINTTVGAGARDVALDPAPLLGSDLVFGAASAAAGIAVADPAAVTRITATGGGVLSYSTGALAATTRYLVLVGDIASDFGVTLVGADWSGTFVSAD